jgi:hypothetical protein
MRVIGFVYAILSASPAFAGKADVLDVVATPEGGGTWRFEVTIKSDDTGWEKYADKWEVVAPDGTVLGTRILAHPHENEQPFTRSLEGIAIPGGIASVTIRAHDKVEGYGGKEMIIPLQASAQGN